MFGGSGDARYNGSSLVSASDGRMLVITFNYRLGVFGFAAHVALREGGSRGANFGLLDQRMAMSWVHANVAAFGGDPARVTLAGESAGATSVRLHLVSPASWPFFSRAIIESLAMRVAGR